MGEITLADLKEYAHLANVVLLPAVWLLYRIGQKIDTLVLQAQAHAEKDDLRFKEHERRVTEVAEDVDKLENRFNEHIEQAHS